MVIKKTNPMSPYSIERQIDSRSDASLFVVKNLKSGEKLTL